MFVWAALFLDAPMVSSILRSCAMPKENSFSGLWNSTRSTNWSITTAQRPSRDRRTLNYETWYQRRYLLWSWHIQQPHWPKRFTVFGASSLRFHASRTWRARIQTGWCYYRHRSHGPTLVDWRDRNSPRALSGHLRRCLSHLSRMLLSMFFFLLLFRYSLLY